MNALKSLQRDRSILISKPDKGNSVILIDKIDYKNKVNLILEDKTKFLKIPNVDQFSKTK